MVIWSCSSLSTSHFSIYHFSFTTVVRALLKISAATADEVTGTQYYLQSRHS